MGNATSIAGENWESFFHELLTPAVKSWLANKSTLSDVRQKSLTLAEQCFDNKKLERPSFQPVSHDNSSGVAFLVLGIICVITGFGLIPLLGPLAIVAIPGSIFWFILARVTWVSREESEESARRKHAQALQNWEQWRTTTIEEVSRQWMLRLHLTIARTLHVPQRLSAQFANASEAHESEFRRDWEDEIQDWISQPEFPPAPAATETRITHAAYEEYCKEMVHSWGFLDAQTTRYARDGGIDVESSLLVVQCKHYKGSVGVREVREIFGIASHKTKRAVLFSAGSFTRDALSFANEAGVALYKLSELNGSPKPQNDHARLLMQERHMKQ